MPQVPSLLPPYSIECSSFPPPIEAAAGSQAWAFQRAFELAREPIRWAILTTMLCWEDDWHFKGTKVPRNMIQQAYDQAPPDLKDTLDYLVTNKVPFYMMNESDRRRYDLCRTGRVQEVETSILRQEDFMRLYDSAVDPVQEAIVGTFKSWTLCEEHELISTVPKREAAQAYAVASDALKLVTSWMLETGWRFSIHNRKAFVFAKETFHEFSLADATSHVELHAMNRLKGMY